MLGAARCIYTVLSDTPWHAIEVAQWKLGPPHAWDLVLTHQQCSWDRGLLLKNVFFFSYMHAVQAVMSDASRNGDIAGHADSAEGA